MCLGVLHGLVTTASVGPVVYSEESLGLECLRGVVNSVMELNSISPFGHTLHPPGRLVIALGRGLGRDTTIFSRKTLF